MTDLTSPSSSKTAALLGGLARCLAGVGLVEAASWVMTGHPMTTQDTGLLGVTLGLVGGTVAVRMTEDIFAKVNTPEFRAKSQALVDTVRDQVGVLGTVAGGYSDVFTLWRETMSRDGVLATWNADRGWLVRREGERTFAPLSDAEFKVLETQVAARGGELNKYVVNGDQMTLMRYVAGKLHGDGPKAPARIELNLENLDLVHQGKLPGLITTSYFRDGRDVTAEVEADLAAAAQARAAVGSRYY